MQPDSPGLADGSLIEGLEYFESFFCILILLCDFAESPDRLEFSIRGSPTICFFKPLPGTFCLFQFLVTQIAEIGSILFELL